MEESILKIDKFGNKFWIKPERYNDAKGFFWKAENEINICTYDGHILHKTDGPAIESIFGTKEWIQNGKLHREDGPAAEYPNGIKYWLQNGKRHREDGPAVEYSNGTKHWFQNGKRHREDGPAIEWDNGDKSWYWHGIRFNTKQQWFVHKLKSIRDGRINS